MPWSSDHTQWLIPTGETIKTIDGKEIAIWEFRHKQDDASLSAWAKHFRNHYCLDTYIDILRAGRTRQEYLTDIKFPDQYSKLGPGIRAGDFAEILIADFAEYILRYWVPRVRWGSKPVRDDSPKGSDVIGFKFQDGHISPDDTLLIFESKTKFSASTVNRLQDAVNDSAKDPIRIDESLNYIKQRLLEQSTIIQAQKISRFQSPADSPYRRIYGAAAVISDDHFNANELMGTNCSKIPKSAKSKELIDHPNIKDLALLVIKGPNMMALVHDLYRRASDEA